MTYSIVIPARYGSSRLPGKPLQDIGGKPMIQRVWEQAKRSSAQRVVIATDDERIVSAAQAFDAQVCMTSPDHPSGTDRLQEVVSTMGFTANDIVVNVQGDEPLIPPSVIDQVAENLEQHTAAAMATLCERITEVEDLLNPNVVKVISDAAGMALYFSRAPVPWPREAFMEGQGELPEHGDWFRHIGIYAYRCGFLDKFVGWEPAPQESLEQLEQLRALHHGQLIHVAVAAEQVPAGVDTAADLEAVREIVRSIEA